MAHDTLPALGHRLENRTALELRTQRIAYAGCEHLESSTVDRLTMTHGSRLHIERCPWCRAKHLLADHVDPRDIITLPAQSAEKVRRTMTRKNTGATPAKTRKGSKPAGEAAASKNGKAAEAAAAEASVTPTTDEAPAVTREPTVAEQVLAEATQAVPVTKSRYHRRPDGPAHHQFPEVRALLVQNRKDYNAYLAKKKGRDAWEGEGDEPCTAEELQTLYDEYKVKLTEYRDAAKAVGEKPLR